MRVDLTIEAKEPRTIRDCEEQIREFRAAAEIVGCQNRGRPNVDALTDRYFDRASELEVAAVDMPLKSISDLVTAFAVYDLMMNDGGFPAEYTDRRDARLLENIRAALVHLEPRPKPRPARDEKGATIADGIEEVRNSLGLIVRWAERNSPSQGTIERLAGAGLVDLLYQQIERLEELGRRIRQ